MDALVNVLSGFFVTTNTRPHVQSDHCVSNDQTALHDSNVKTFGYNKQLPFTARKTKWRKGNVFTHVCLFTGGSAFSSGSSSRIGGGKKHEIYVAAFGGHLFLQDLGGGAWPLGPLDPLVAFPQYCWAGRPPSIGRPVLYRQTPPTIYGQPAVRILVECILV